MHNGEDRFTAPCRRFKATYWIDIKSQKIDDSQHAIMTICQYFFGSEVARGMYNCLPCVGFHSLFGDGIRHGIGAAPPAARPEFRSKITSHPKQDIFYLLPKKKKNIDLP